MVDKIHLMCPRCGGEKKTKQSTYCQPCTATLYCKKRWNKTKKLYGYISNNRKPHTHKKPVTLAKVWNNVQNRNQKT